MHFGPHFSESLKELSGKGFSTGLVLGSQLGDRAFAVCLVETPAETTDVAGAEAEKTKNIDVSWMLEHAKQVYRLLPGGITILGSFVFHTEDIFAKQDGKIRKLVGGISGLDESVPDNQVIIVSSNIAKSYETKSSSFKSVDMKPQDKPIQFVRADTSMILDLPVARPKEEELSQDLIPAVRKLEENLAGCIFVIGNKILPDDQQLGKPLEIDKKKGGSQRAVKSQQESADSSELEDVQEIVSVQLLVTDAGCPDSVSSQQSEVRLKVAGKLCSRSYLAPGATVLQAKQEIRRDLLRSLRTRFAMHCDTMQQEEGEEEEKRIVHEPPRRVFVSLNPPELELAISDYLYPGEGAEDCISNMKELFGWEISEDNIEDDVEIVASPRDTRGPPPPLDPSRNRRAKLPLAAVASLGMAALAVGIAYFSIGE